MIGILAVIAASASAPGGSSDLPGVWSLGETRNCASGPAWVFFADGIYAEMTLPSSNPSAIGLWEDQGGAIVFTHAHLPYAGHERPMPKGTLTIIERSADRIEARSRRAVTRVFHRCPSTALKAPEGAGSH